MKIFFLSCLICFCLDICYGQDTLVYCQKNSPWISNCYYFYKSSKKMRNGIFQKSMESDDGQNWYGIGKFRETKRRIVIFSFSLIRTYDKSVKDSTTIQTFKFIKKNKSLIQSGNKKSEEVIFALRLG